MANRMFDAQDVSSDPRRSNVFLGIAIGCGVLFTLLFEFRRELCHSFLPLAFLMMATPIAGSVAGLICLFNPRSSLLAVGGKLAVLGANLYALGMASISMVGIGVFNCS